MTGSRFAVVLALLQACGDLVEEKNCTAAGCIDGFLITAAANEELPASSYELQLTLDGVLVTCTHPLLVAAPASNGTCSSTAVRSQVVIHNGGAPGSGAANGFSIRILETPSRVLLRVLRDGALVAEQTYDPIYQTIMPNGPECGPVCEGAADQELPLVFE